MRRFSSLLFSSLLLLISGCSLEGVDGAEPYSGSASTGQSGRPFQYGQAVQVSFQDPDTSGEGVSSQTEYGDLRQFVNLRKTSGGRSWYYLRPEDGFTAYSYSESNAFQEVGV